jgi:hypothetical protein
MPGKIFMAFNLTKSDPNVDVDSSLVDPLSGGVMNHITKDEHNTKFACHGRKLIEYDVEMHSNKAIFFPGDYREDYRLLTHFYAYLHFADEHVEHLYMRIVRDRLHYHDDIFCAAGRAIKLILEDAAKLASEAMASEVDTRGDPERAADTVVMEKGRDKVQTLEMANELTGGGNTNFGAVYHAAHIRRGDFQYDQALIGADEIYKNIHLLFNRSVSTLLYISTDEGNKTFFEPFHKHFTVRFLADFMEPAKIGASHLNQNHIGMVEQTICANAHTFVGTPWSTFTGYITRMRGW